MQRPVMIVVLLLVVALGVAVWYWSRGPAEEPAPLPAQQEPAVEAEPAPEEEEAPSLPPLGASDDLVRQLAERLTDDPALAAALVPEDLLRRFVAATHAVARGRSPRRPLSHMEPEGRFRVREQDDALVMSPDTVDRYDAWADLVASLDPAATVRVYRRLEPLIDDAYRELGDPEAEFDDTLLAALDHLLAVEVPEGRIRIDDTGYEYLFEDPRLQEASPAQKHLLRMGSDNARQVQAKLREIRRELTGRQ